MTRRLFLPVLAVLASLAVLTSTAQAGFGFVPGSVKVEALDAEGHPDHRAGAHPDRLDIGLDLNTEEEKVEGNLKELAIDLPPGFVGDGSAVPVCPRTVYDGSLDGEECPADSQIGVVTTKFPTGETEELAVYNVEPAPGGTTEIGSVFLLKIPVVTRLRPTDGGATLVMEDTSQSITISGVTFELWGVPADHQSGTGIPRRPFVTLPTDCAPEGLRITARARSWQEPGVWHEERSAGFALDGCDGLAFDPGMALELGNPRADAPTGTDFDLTLPESNDPDGRAGPSIKSVNVALPEGMAVAPSGAQSRVACSDAEFGAVGDGPPNCPAGSKVGTVEVEGAALGSAVSGVAYIGEERPGERMRLLIAFSAAGTVLRATGTLTPDPQTGRPAVRLDGLPRVPFARMSLHLEGGPRALLATPLGCGPVRTTATFSAYGSNATVVAHADNAIAGSDGGRCDGGPAFAPLFSAGAGTSRAGADTSLSMTLRRQGGEQLAERFGVTLPPGLTARLGRFEACPSAAAAIGACSAGSRIGSAVAEVGSGPSPAPLAGDVYLTSGYRGAPFGLALVFGAKLGPFDLGRLVVQATMRMDLLSGKIAIQTDPLPRILAGVPIRFQTVGIDIDKPGFAVNPTSCAPSGFDVDVRAVDGRTAAARAPFALRGCGSLPFRPRVRLGVVGNSLGKGDPVGFRIGLRMPPHGTNLGGMSVPLPTQLRFATGKLDELCAAGDAREGECPHGSRVGAASARTPLLSKPLKGSVYVAQPSGNGAPDIWTILSGQGLEVAIRAKMSNRHGRLVANIVDVPDVPMSDLRLSLASPSSGIVSLRHGLCPGGRAFVPASRVGLEGQDGAYLFKRVPVTHARCAAGPQARAERRRADRDGDDRA